MGVNRRGAGHGSRGGNKIILKVCDDDVLLK
jgi:hypothetical protein